MNYVFLLVGKSKSYILHWLGRFVPQYKSRQLFAPVEPIIVVFAHDGDHNEDDIDESDEVLPVHTNQRQMIDTSVGLLVTASPSITIAA